MTQAVLQRICAVRIEAVREIANSLRGRFLAEGASVIVRDLEDLVHECQELVGLLMEAWARLMESVEDDSIEDIRQEGELLRDDLERCLEACNAAFQLLTEVEAHGRRVHGSTELSRGIFDLQQTTAHLEKSWSFRDRQTIDQSLAAYARGESQTAQQVFDELRRNHSAAN
ncbi:MAG: hypothetical protein HY000_27405 [Planctomycetes bacterium]|nr:hypothetical protein [Planctomycetota bacterium]